MPPVQPLLSMDSLARKKVLTSVLGLAMVRLSFPFCKAKTVNQPRSLSILSRKGGRAG